MPGFNNTTQLCLQAAQKQPEEPPNNTDQQHSNDNKGHQPSALDPRPKQPLPDQAAAAHVDLPMTDAENAALPAVEGVPEAGDVVAYKLLQIGYDWTPQVD